MRKFLITSLALCSLFISVPTSIVSAEQVAFNQQTHKVHKMSCRYAKKSRNMIFIDRKEAYKRGGVPCKICGG